MPGSVIASAVISEPSAMPGSQRSPLLVGAVLEEVGHADVVVQREAEARAGDAGVAHLLHHDLVEAEVVDAEAAERLGHSHREHALVRRLREQLTRDEAVLLPLLVVGDDLLREEAPHGLAIVLVLGLEDGSLHDRHTVRVGLTKVRPTDLY